MTMNNTKDDNRGDSFAEAHGSAALRWIAEPTRAGRWWLWHARWSKIELVEVMSVGAKGKFRMLGHIFDVPAAHGQGWWWAGPIEPPEPPIEATPPNDQAERP